MNARGSIGHPKPMSHRLLVNPGTPQAWEISLKSGVNRIGRGEANDFQIPHPSVSGAHCEVVVSGTGVTLRDLGSTNGSLVALDLSAPLTQLISGQPLRDGNVLRIGDILLAFRCYRRTPGL